MSNRTVRSRRTLSRINALVLCLGICLAFGLAGFAWQSTTGAASTTALPSAPDREGTIFAVTSANNLISFNSVTPGVILSNRAITGLETGETIVGLDFRPRTGQLFALTSIGRRQRLTSRRGSRRLRTARSVTREH